MAELRPKPVLSRIEEAKPEQLPRLYDFIPRLGRNYAEPRHLEPLVRQLETSWEHSVYQTCHAPPRHGKTDTVLADIALTLRRQPWKTLAYITYESAAAQAKSRKARSWFLAAGGKLADDAQRLSEWRTREGGGLIAGGIGGPLTGKGVDKLYIDDPYKNRQQAESRAYSRMVRDWFGDVAETRIEPGGSVFIFHTRWVEDDLTGWVLKDPDIGPMFRKHILLAALDEEGRPLWGDRFSKAALERKRAIVGELAWASLYQGTPRPRGGAVFNGTHLHSGLRVWERLAIGVDFAYSTRKSSDWSVAVVMAEWQGKYYVLEVLRRQVPAPQFRKELRALAARWQCSRAHAYLAGIERGIADFVNEVPWKDEDAGQEFHLEMTAATADKLVRAQPTAAAWNRGDILIPEAGEDISKFSGVVLGFTGAQGGADDDVDALVAAYDHLAAGQAEYDPEYDQYLPAMRA